MDANELLAQLTNNPDILIVEKDCLSRFTDCNDRWMYYAHLKKKDAILGLNDHACAWEEFAPQYRKVELDILSGKAYGIVHPCAVGESQRSCWIHCYKWPKYNEIGKIVGLNVIAYEVRDRATLEALFLLSNKNKFGLKEYTVDKSTHEHLTEREKEVLFCLCYGMSAQRIADLMRRSKRTVEIHIDHIKTKFCCHSKAQLIEYAAAQGYVSILPGHLLEGETPITTGFSNLCQFIGTAFNANAVDFKQIPNLSPA